MRHIITTGLASWLLFSVPCLGEDAPKPAAAAPAAAAPTAAAPAAAPARPAGETAAGKPKAREVRANCRAEAEAKGLKGAERKAAVKECFAKARPDLAAAGECRKEGKAKGLADKELRDFVKTCKQGKL